MPEYENGTLIVNREGIFVYASVNAVKVRFMVDSGSRPTILNTKVFSRMPEEVRPPLTEDYGLKVADGNPLSNKGRGEFSLNLGAVEVQHHIYVADIEEEGLLGYDFLHRYQCDLLFKSKRLIVNDPDPDNDNQHDIEDDSRPMMCHRVAVKETTVIAANSEQLLSAKLVTRPQTQGKQMGVLEPRDVFVKKHAVIVASTLVDAENDVIPIRVLNPTTKPVKIYKNTVAAVYHEVSDIITDVDPDDDGNSQEGSTRCRHVIDACTTADAETKKCVPATEVETKKCVPAAETETKKCVPTAETETRKCVPAAEVETKICVPDHLVDLWQRSCTELNEAQAAQVAKLLCNYSEVFSSSPNDIGLTNLVEHKIKLQDSTPIKQPARRKPIHMRDEEKRHVQDLLKRGLIEPSESPWASPTVLVRKKNGETRFCVDYRRVNERTIKDSYPLPLISDALDCLEGAKWFSTLDLASGYWQVPLAESSRPVTAFVSETSGHWQWKVLPFGLCNAPACFERLMEKVLAGLHWKSCLLYLDDIISHATTFDGAINRLEEVFQRLKDANLKVGPDKCHLFQKKVTYLGHVVSEDGIATDESKISAVVTWPTPENLTETRSWLGFTSYYRRFIKGYAEIAKPLYRLTEKNAPFSWTPQCNEAFKKLKEALITAPVLAYPSSNGSYILDCDASNIGLGAVLSVKQDGDDVERPVAYYSKTLTKSERRYCVTRRELLAIVASIKEFHHYLYGRQFTIRTDHGALRWLTNFKNPQAQTARWIEILGTYDYKIQHRPGRFHQNADGLSRRPCASCKQCEKIELQNDDEHPIHIGRRPKTGNLCSEHEQCQDDNFEMSKVLSSKTPPSLVAAISTEDSEKQPESAVSDTVDVENANQGDMNETWVHQWTSSQLRQAQQEDTILKQILSWKEANNERPKWHTLSHQSPTLKTYWSHWDQLCVIDGVLYKRWVSEWGDEVVWKLVIPQQLRSMVFNNLHKHRTAGHLGEKKTINRIGERYWWVNWRAFVTQGCKKCDSCAAKKPPRKTPRAPMKIYNVGAPMERIAIDVMGPLPESDRGNKYILVVGDHFTKWMEAYAMPNQEAITVARVLAEEFICRYGVPRIIHSDQGRNFESTLFTELCKLLDIDKVRSSALHAQTNGMVERQNKVIQNMLSMFVATNQRDWDVHLPYMMMAYRSATHESVKCSPNEMVFGRSVELPIDIILGRPPEEPNIHSTEYIQNLQSKLELVHAYARQNLTIASQKQKKYYDHRCDRRPLFERGDAVWLHNPQRKKGVCPKLSLQWEGPYLVVERLCDVVFKIQRNLRSKPKVVHANRLKKYLGENPPSSWLVPLTNDNTDKDQADNNESKEDSVESFQDQSESEIEENNAAESLSNQLNHESDDDLHYSQEPESIDENENRPTDGLRRSSRNRKPPKKFDDFLLDVDSLS